MPTITQLRRALRMLRHRELAERDLNDEIRSHIALEIERNVARGMAPAAARELAEREFGRVTDVRDDLREIHSLGLVSIADGLRTDARVATRSLVRAPVFTIGVVASLAIGIAASATMFGLVDRILLRPPAYVVDPQQVGRLYLTRPNGKSDGPTRQMSFFRFTQLAEAVRGRAELAVSSRVSVVVGEGQAARQIPAMLVTPNFFSLIGVQPRAGRFFTTEEGAPPDGGAVMVIGYEFWQREFGGNDSAIGRSLRLGTKSYTIVGVAPRGLTGVDLERVDAFLPATGVRTVYTFLPPVWYQQHNFPWAEVIARRSPNTPRRELDTLLTRGYVASLELAGVKEARAGRAAFGPLHLDRGPTPSDGSRVTVWLSVVSAVLLLVACSNVANLLLARALRRRREIGIRVALGVSRWRLLGQLMTESIFLSVVAGVVALVLTVWTGRAATAILLPNAEPGAAVDLRIFGATMVISLLVGVVTGLAPAMHTLRSDIAHAVKADGGDGPYQRLRLRGVLLALQAGVSLALLVVAGLFIRSMVNVHATDLGFDPRPTVLVEASTRGEELAGGTRALYDQLEERARPLPFVVSISKVQSIPFGIGFESDFSVPGVDSASTRGSFYLSAVEPTYFATMGTGILAGRGFTAADVAGSQLVTVVDERMARLFWPNESPLGKCVRIGGDAQPCSTVIGVARAVHRNGLRPEETMHYYTADAQRQPNTLTTGLVVRVSGSPAAVVETIRRELQSVAPGAVYVRVRPFTELVEPSGRSWRLGAIVFGIFGGVALVIAASGLYAVIAYAAAQRVREIGVRAALGAPAWHVVATVVSEGLKASAVGLAIGAVLTMAAGKWLSPLLFDVSPTDPMVFATVIVSLLLAAVLAGLVPALRATRVDPMTALRGE